MSNVSRGNYYLNKTIKYFEAEDYQTEKLEKLTGFFAKGRMNWRKSDMMFSDMLIYNEKEFVLIQVKGGIGSLKINKAIDNYVNLKVPDFIQKWVVVWRPRIRQPEIHECRNI